LSQINTRLNKVCSLYSCAILGRGHRLASIRLSCRYYTAVDPAASTFHKTVFSPLSSSITRIVDASLQFKEDNDGGCEAYAC